MHKENLVQGAITSSLEVYCDRNWLHSDIFAPYPNQQGAGFSSYCADLIALLGRSRVLMLEVKELDLGSAGSAATLPAYSSYQHLLDWIYEDLGVPLFYGYASVDELSYFCSSRERQWPNSSLFKVCLCRPSELFSTSTQQASAEPDRGAHSNLLAWLLDPPPASSALMGVLVSLRTTQSSELRNRLIVVACDALEGPKLRILPAVAVKVVVDDLINGRQQTVGVSNDSSMSVSESLEGATSKLERLEKEKAEIDARIDQELEGSIAARSGRLADKRRRKLAETIAGSILNDRIANKVAENASDPKPSPAGRRPL